MTGIMAAFVGMGGGLTISITAATASNIGTPTYYFYGWSSVGGIVSLREFFPLATMGSQTAGPTTFNGATIIGVYSSSLAGTGTATRYTVVLDGNRSLGFVSGMTVNGTPISTASPGRSVDGTNNMTALYFDVASAATLFTASSTVSIY